MEASTDSEGELAASSGVGAGFSRLRSGRWASSRYEALDYLEALSTGGAPLLSEEVPRAPARVHRLFWGILAVVASLAVAAAAAAAPACVQTAVLGAGRGAARARVADAQLLEEEEEQQPEAVPPEANPTGTVDACSDSGSNCWDTRCCKDPALTCFAQDLGWAQCNASCEPGSVGFSADPMYVETKWMCTEVTLHAGVDVGRALDAPPDGESASAPEPGSDKCAAQDEYCMRRPCCDGEGTKCFKKNSMWAACKQSCTPGVNPYDPEWARTNWSCEEVVPARDRTGEETLFCFALMLPESYEVGLIQTQLDRGVGIFACDTAAVYSNATVKLTSKVIDGSLETQIVSGSLHCEPGGPYYTALNSEIFVRVWKRVMSGPEFRRHGWTVKADPDAVVLPHRLRLRAGRSKFLQGRLDKVYINNCQFGMHGPIEMMSRDAMEAYNDGLDKCVDALKSEFTTYGEDVFLRECLALLGVSSVDDFSMMKETHCDWHGLTDQEVMPCDMGRAAYHPLKTEEDWVRCHEQAMSEEPETTATTVVSVISITATSTTTEVTATTTTTATATTKAPTTSSKAATTATSRTVTTTTKVAVTTTTTDARIKKKKTHHTTSAAARANGQHSSHDDVPWFISAAVMPAHESCQKYGGVPHSDNMTCCPAECGDHCGAADCHEHGSGCCGSSLPIRLCSLSAAAPCTLGPKLPLGSNGAERHGSGEKKGTAAEEATTTAAAASGGVPWVCHQYEEGQDFNWCRSAPPDDEYEYKFFGPDSPCDFCWCCKRTLRKARSGDAGESTTKADANSTSPAPFDCDAGFEHWKSGWSRAKKSWCCQNAQVGCEASARTTTTKVEVNKSKTKTKTKGKSKGKGKSHATSHKEAEALTWRDVWTCLVWDTVPPGENGDTHYKAQFVATGNATSGKVRIRSDGGFDGQGTYHYNLLIINNMTGHWKQDGRRTKLVWSSMFTWTRDEAVEELPEEDSVVKDVVSEVVLMTSREPVDAGAASKAADNTSVQTTTVDTPANATTAAPTTSTAARTTTSMRSKKRASKMNKKGPTTLGTNTTATSTAAATTPSSRTQTSATTPTTSAAPTTSSATTMSATTTRTTNKSTSSTETETKSDTSVTTSLSTLTRTATTSSHTTTLSDTTATTKTTTTALRPTATTPILTATTSATLTPIRSMTLELMVMKPTTALVVPTTVTSVTSTTPQATGEPVEVSGFALTARQGCSNWRDIKILEGGTWGHFSADSASACGYRCTSTTGCVSFGFKARPGGFKDNVENECMLFSGECQPQIDAVWDYYQRVGEPPTLEEAKAAQNCNMYDGVPHFDEVTCCHKSCGDLCGATDCDAKGEDLCCGTGIPDGQACGEGRPAPCTMQLVLGALQRQRSEEVEAREEQRAAAGGEGDAPEGDAPEAAEDHTHRHFTDWECVFYDWQKGGKCHDGEVMDGFEHHFFGEASPCLPCWCCKRPADEKAWRYREADAEAVHAADVWDSLASQPEADEADEANEESDSDKWICHEYDERVVDTDGAEWCRETQSSGSSDGWEYHYFGKDSPDTCESCWCCKRPAASVATAAPAAAAVGARESCDSYGGIAHFDEVTCCDQSCGEHCGANDCAEYGEDLCCGGGIPESQVCSPSQPAPCTMQTALADLRAANGV